MSMEISAIRTYLAIYLVSAASLTYEIALTRIFSIANGYHFSFMVISISLMGIGAGGSLLAAGRWTERVETGRLLSIMASLLSITIVLSSIASGLILFDPVRAAWSRAEFLKIFYQYLILSTPFLFSGMIIASAIRTMSERVHKIYFFDLMGAGTGCLLILFILSKTSGENAVIISALMVIPAVLLFKPPASLKELTASIAPAMLISLLLLLPGEAMKIEMSPYRPLSAALNFPGAMKSETIFSPAGRIDIIDSPAVRAAPGLSLEYEGALPKQLGFTLNGGSLQTVTDGKGDISFLAHLPSALAYRIKKPQRVFIINPGGGMALLGAIENGADRINGSERSRAVVNTMTGQLKLFSGDLYTKGNISYGPARHLLDEADGPFQIIELPLTGTLGSSSSGIRGLQEDHSLTVEAFADYLSHLLEGGVLSISTYLLPPPRQEIKLLATLVSALESTGTEEASASIIAIRSWGVLNIIAKKGTVNAEEIEETKNFCRDEGFDLVWYPGMKEEEANVRNRFNKPFYHQIFRKVMNRHTREAFYDDYLYDVRPATDERPFPGQTFKIWRMKETYESAGGKLGILIEGGYLLPWILIQASLASFILIVMPLLAAPIAKINKKKLFHTTIYFGAIGLGFMFIEIVMIQRMIPLLGEAVYAISAVIASLLISSGVGSYLSGRLDIIRRFSPNSMLALPLLITVYLALLIPLHSFMPALDLFAKYLAVFLFLFPLGLAMGVPFPAGMSILGEKQASLIPWAWCINGSFSVLGSILAMMIAIGYGFSALQILAAIAYAVSWIALRGLIRG